MGAIQKKGMFKRMKGGMIFVKNSMLCFISVNFFIGYLWANFEGFSV